MTRQIKRYGSRKLYDPTDSRYVSLEEVAGWIRAGEQVQAVDNKTGEDVTAQVLTQVISEESRRGAAALPAHFLHDLIRWSEGAVRVGEQALRASEAAVGQGVRQVQQQVEGFVSRGIERITPTVQVREVRDEMQRLRERLERLEGALTHLAPDAPTGSPEQAHSDDPDAPASADVSGA